MVSELGRISAHELRQALRPGGRAELAVPGPASAPEEAERVVVDGVAGLVRAVDDDGGDACDDAAEDRDRVTAEP